MDTSFPATLRAGQHKSDTPPRSAAARLRAGIPAGWLLAVLCACAGEVTEPDSAGVGTQTPSSLMNDGPQAEYIVLDWDGSENVVITEMASGKVPLGRAFLIEVPRTTSGSDGGGTGTLGNYVRFTHGNSINCAANHGVSYDATPNATGKAARSEILEFVRVGDDQFVLTRIPESPEEPSPPDEELQGVARQTMASLVHHGPQAEYIILEWSGNSNVTVAEMASGKVPLGKPFLLHVPRTIGNSGGPGGHGTEALGNYVEFVHGSSINCAANGGLSYRATPNANDWRGDNAALFELLEFVRVGDGKFTLTRLPEPVTGFTHGNPEHVPGTSSRTGFSWERRADGTAHLTNGTVRIPAYLDGTPRFRLQFVWPFRFEQHHGNHRCVQMGISTKNTDVYWTDLSVPRNSSTDRTGMLVTVYVAPTAQSLVRIEDSVNVIIMATGNWRLPSDQW